MRVYGTIPVDPSDDAGDEGGISDWVSLNKQATDPNSHTLVKSLLQETQRYRYLQIPMVDPKYMPNTNKYQILKY